MSNDIIKFKRGNENQKPSLLQGEPFFSWDTQKIFVGGLSGAIPFGRENVKNVLSYGAVGDGVINDTLNLQNALNDLSEGEILIFPMGFTFLFDEIEVTTKGVTLTGGGTLLINTRLLIKNSDISIHHLKFDSNNIQNLGANGVVGYANLINTDIQNIRIFNNEFYNFSYATDFRGNSLDNINPPLHHIINLEIYNNLSVANVGTNAGHFQHTGCKNVKIHNNSTYNGQNATSYNFFSNCEDIVITANYDDNNSYGSCEIENGSKNVVINGNMFKQDLLIDDCENVLITNNIMRQLRLTVGIYDTKNIKISNNRIGSFSIASDASYIPGNMTYNIELYDNTFYGDVRSWGILTPSGLVNEFIVKNNIFDFVYTSGQIGMTNDITVKANIEGNIINGDFTVSQTDGEIQFYNNKEYTLNGSVQTIKLRNFFDTEKDVVFGDTSGNVALQNLLSELARQGIITDSTT